MAVWQIFKVSRKTFFNPRAWLDVDGVRTSTRNLWVIIRDLFVQPTPTRRETFSEAKKRLNLTDAELKNIGQRYQLFSYMFLLLGITVLVFSFYLFIYHFTISGFILGVVTALLFFGQAFRYNFYYFQIKHKKLGCTFKEWREGKVLRNSHHD